MRCLARLYTPRATRDAPIDPSGYTYSYPKSRNHACHRSRTTFSASGDTRACWFILKSARLSRYRSTTGRTPSNAFPHPNDAYTRSSVPTGSALSRCQSNLRLSFRRHLCYVTRVRLVQQLALMQNELLRVL